MITAREITQMVGVSVSTVGRAMADNHRVAVDQEYRRQADILLDPGLERLPGLSDPGRL